MKIQLTGHPFIDAGTAGMAALLEQYGQVVSNPAQLDQQDLLHALDLLESLYCHRIAADSKSPDKMPLLYYLLQEVLPGSSWDQAKTGKDVAGSKEAKFKEYITELRTASQHPPIGLCFITGSDAHVVVDKSKLPMFASGSERPNCYPNLCAGAPVSAWVALAILFSPISIEKTVNLKGNGSECLIYHSTDWRFMVEVAKRNLRRLQALLAAKSIDSFRSDRYKKKVRFRNGTWKMALSTTMHALNRLDEGSRLGVSIWSFNASNTSCRYSCCRVSDSFLKIHQGRRQRPRAYAEVPRCSDAISNLILEGKPIVAPSLIVREARGKLKDADQLTHTALQPSWAFQRLYAEEVLRVPSRLLNVVEQAAQHLVQDPQAVRYCLYDAKTISPSVLASRYCLPADLCVVFSDYPRLWQDYLRAAVVSASKGYPFGAISQILDSPGPVEMLIKEVAGRLGQKHRYKRLASRLSASIPRKYRAAWIGLLNDGACTWEDFLVFNPLDEALSIGRYYNTRIRRDYLVAYLLALSNSHKAQTEAETEEDELDRSVILLTIIAEEDEEP